MNEKLIKMRELNNWPKWYGGVYALSLYFLEVFLQCYAFFHILCNNFLAPGLIEIVFHDWCPWPNGVS